MFRLLAFLILFNFATDALAQIPELEQNMPDSQSFKQLNDLEKARVYYNRGEYTHAEMLFYQELDLEHFTTRDFLLFANCLMALNKTALARDIFNEYLRLSGNNYGYISDLVTGLFVTDSSTKPLIRVHPVTEGVHGLSYYRGEVYTARSGSLVHYPANCPGELKEEIPLNFDNAPFEYGSVTFFNSGFNAVISKLDRKSGKYSLYMLLRTPMGGWTVEKRLKFSESSANYAFPYFDEQRSILYFASDQEGGSGGYDLYFCYYTNGKFDRDIVNLGSMINTAGNEIYPYYHDGWLYFSSNGYPSKGGYDIYRYKALDDFTSLVRNVKVFSSEGHDFAIAYQSSDQILVNRQSKVRLGIVSFTVPPDQKAFAGRVISENGTAIRQAYIFNENEQGKGIFVISDENGIFRLHSNTTSENLLVNVMADGFQSESVLLDAGKEKNITLKADKPVEIIKVVEKNGGKDSGEVRYISAAGDSRSGTSEATSEITEPSIRGVVLPKTGKFYVILGSAKDYAFAYRMWSTWVDSFPSLEIIKFGEQLYRIGFMAGNNELDAIAALRETINIKPGAWIVRPGSY